MHGSEVSEGVLWAGAIAIVVSALVAGVVTIWRTKALLIAEAERLDKQLRHDRAQNEREELRSVIDAVMENAQEGQYRGVELLLLIQQIDREGVRDADELAYENGQAALTASLRAVNGLQSRLAIRLPADAPLPGRAAECRQALAMVSMYAGLAWPWSERHDRDELKGLLDVSEGKIEVLETEARLLARSELMADS